MSEQSINNFIEELTPREIDILNLLAEGLSNQEIANVLVVAVGTVKWHNNQIYSKLHVKNRKQAVTRARTLGLLDLRIDDPLLSIQHNLPTDTLPFIGRGQEIDYLVQQLTTDGLRLTTILGPGGMGKTRLAIEVGRRLLSYFVDGVYFIPLASVESEEHIVTTFANQIGYDFHDDASPMKQLLAYMSGQQLLLIIDNFDHLVDSAGLLTEILYAVPKLKMLVTSREKLALSGEDVLVIGGLSISSDWSADSDDHDAVQLFLEVANRATSGVIQADMKVVTNICQMLGGMPLAILLAASWLDVLSTVEIETEIQTGLGILESPRRDAPPRHQSIEAVFDYSWRMLTSHEQAVFMRLSVFRGSFTREAAKAVAGASLRDLMRLIHTSFVQHSSSGRYTIHDLMRQYGEAKLAQSGELDMVSDQHAHFFNELVAPLRDQVWPGGDLALLEAINADFENVRAAWKFRVEQKNFTELANIYDGLWLYIDSYSRGQDAIELNKLALASIGEDDSTEARLLRARILRDWSGLKWVSAAVALLQPFGKTHLLMLAYLKLTIGSIMAGDWQRALEACHQGLAIAQDICTPDWQQVFCDLIANIHYETGMYQEALTWLAEEPVGEVGRITKAAVLNQLGEYEVARECLLESLKINQYHRYGMVKKHHYLVENAVLMEDYEQAWRYLQRGLQYVDDVHFALGGLELLAFALGLFIAEEQYVLAAEVMALITHHPKCTGVVQSQVAKHENKLQAILPPNEYAAAWERGQNAPLGELVTELMER